MVVVRMVGDVEEDVVGGAHRSAGYREGRMATRGTAASTRVESGTPAHRSLLLKGTAKRDHLHVN